MDIVTSISQVVLAALGIYLTFLKIRDYRNRHK